MAVVKKWMRCSFEHRNIENVVFKGRQSPPPPYSSELNMQQNISPPFLTNESFSQGKGEEKADLLNASYLLCSV
jgi:hypothetical protein